MLDAQDMRGGVSSLLDLEQHLKVMEVQLLFARRYEDARLKGILCYSITALQQQA
jgi:hypothetical protein